MRIRSLLVHAAFAAWIVSIYVTRADAQQFESVGIRAQGMAGAFVAVADDATATWWNPAGLAGGPYLDGLVEYGTLRQPEAPAPAGELRPARQTRTRGFAFAYPAAGVSYYRLKISEIRPLGSTAPDGSDRDNPGGMARLRAFSVSQYGLTVGQSLGPHLVVGSTLKLVRGSVAAADVTAADATFGRADELDGDTDTHTDLDVGAMASFDHLRFGVTMRNVREPEFGPASDREQLLRRARAGVAVIARPNRGLDQLTVAADVDLTEAETVLGEAKYVAAGAEVWLFGRRIGVRGGASRNLRGAQLLSPSGGLSLAFSNGAYLEGQYTAGRDRGRRGWGVDLRVTF
ncbi:MAG: conjugal transfer protein TraF [Acidobacteria bacterium]|nr:conjugal transfer protein TraF [Acidobacteriota bacterium]